MPGLNYPLETFVESLSDKGISDLIKVGRLLVPLGEDSGGECGQGPRVATGQGGHLHRRGLTASPSPLTKPSLVASAEPMQTSLGSASAGSRG